MSLAPVCCLVHASQGHKVGLYTPTILGGNYDRGAIKRPPHTGTSEGLSQAINRGPIRKFLPNYANVYVTIQRHGFSAGVRTHYVTANGVRNRLRETLPRVSPPGPRPPPVSSHDSSVSVFHTRPISWMPGDHHRHTSTCHSQSENRSDGDRRVWSYIHICRWYAASNDPTIALLSLLFPRGK